MQGAIGHETRRRAHSLAGAILLFGPGRALHHPPRGRNRLPVGEARSASRGTLKSWGQPNLRSEPTALLLEFPRVRAAGKVERGTFRLVPTGEAGWETLHVEARGAALSKEEARLDGELTRLGPAPRISACQAPSAPTNSDALKVPLGMLPAAPSFLGCLRENIQSDRPSPWNWAALPMVLLPFLILGIWLRRWVLSQRAIRLDASGDHSSGSLDSSACCGRHLRRRRSA